MTTSPRKHRAAVDFAFRQGIRGAESYLRGLEDSFDAEATEDDKASLYRAIAISCMRQGKLVEAIASMRRAERLLLGQTKWAPEELANFNFELGAMLQRGADLVGASHCASRSLAIARTTDADLRHLCIGLVPLLWEIGRHDDAIGLCREWAALEVAHLGKGEFLPIDSHAVLSELLESEGRWEEALESATTAQALAVARGAEYPVVAERIERLTKRSE
jgi:tetratricopeptide (TPR) repeat protein